ncbi:unnamed protein product [Boreogadus saida]
MTTGRAARLLLGGAGGDLGFFPKLQAAGLHPGPTTTRGVVLSPHTPPVLRQAYVTGWRVTKSVRVAVLGCCPQPLCERPLVAGPWWRALVDRPRWTGPLVVVPLWFRPLVVSAVGGGRLCRALWGVACRCGVKAAAASVWSAAAQGRRVGTLVSPGTPHPLNPSPLV